MFNPFRKIREAAKNALIGGIQDGVEELFQDKTATIVRVEAEVVEDKPEASPSPRRPKVRS